MEAERDAEVNRNQEMTKELKKKERSLKELSTQSEEDKRNYSRLQELVENLQNKLRVYKKQIEDTEEIAAVNLTKYRKAQNELADAVERADQAENRRAKSRAANRSTVTPQVNHLLIFILKLFLIYLFINNNNTNREIKKLPVPAI